MTSNGYPLTAGGIPPEYALVGMFRQKQVQHDVNTILGGRVKVGGQLGPPHLQSRHDNNMDRLTREVQKDISKSIRVLF